MKTKTKLIIGAFGLILLVALVGGIYFRSKEQSRGLFYNRGNLNGNKD